MSINFQCPNCGAEHSAADLAAGRRIRCPSCDTMIEVPRPEPAMAEAPAAGGAPEGSSQAEPPPPLTEESSSESATEKTKFAPRKRGTDGEIDMTPMVDVVFNLLIFFMVTATFVQQRSLEHPKPEQSDQPSTQVMNIEDNPDVITVLVDENNTFLVSTVDFEKECAGEHELLAQLREAQDSSRGKPPSKLLVKAHVDALHEYVVMALDAGTAAGIEEVQIVTVEENI